MSDTENPLKPSAKEWWRRIEEERQRLEPLAEELEKLASENRISVTETHTRTFYEESWSETGPDWMQIAKLFELALAKYSTSQEVDVDRTERPNAPKPRSNRKASKQSK